MSVYFHKKADKCQTNSTNINWRYWWTRSSKMASANDLPKMENLKVEDDYQTYKLGDFKLKSGGEIPDAFIAYKTLGDPSLPAIIYPSWYSGCQFHLSF